MFCFSDIFLFFICHLSLSIVHLLIERSCLSISTRHAPLLLIGYVCVQTQQSKSLFFSLSARLRRAEPGCHYLILCLPMLPFIETVRGMDQVTMNLGVRLLWASFRRGWDDGYANRLVAVCGIWSEHWQADLPLLRPLKQCCQHSCVCFCTWRTAQRLNLFDRPLVGF